MTEDEWRERVDVEIDRRVLAERQVVGLTRELAETRAYLRVLKELGCAREGCPVFAGKKRNRLPGIPGGARTART